jgi:hypothetical protein
LSLDSTVRANPGYMRTESADVPRQCPCDLVPGVGEEAEGRAGEGHAGAVPEFVDNDQGLEEAVVGLLQRPAGLLGPADLVVRARYPRR